MTTGAHEDGELTCPAAALPVEIYSEERKAEFLLSNAVDEHDYVWARHEVLRLGLDPDQVPDERQRSR